MSQQEEWELMQAIKAAGHEPIAEALVPVFERRDENYRALMGRLNESANTSAVMYAKLEKHMAKEDELPEMFKAAFPNQDIRAHREYHEKLIAAKEAETAFWTDLKLDLAKKGTWAVLIVVIGLVVTGAAAKLGIGK